MVDDSYGATSDGGGFDSDLSIDPTGEVDFGILVLDSGLQQAEMVLWSAGESPVVILDVFLDGGSGSGFYVNDDLPLPLTLEPEAEFPVKVFFDPAQLGDFTDLFVVEVDRLGETVTRTRGVLAEVR